MAYMMRPTPKDGSTTEGMNFSSWIFITVGL